MGATLIHRFDTDACQIHLFGKPQRRPGSPAHLRAAGLQPRTRRRRQRSARAAQPEDRRLQCGGTTAGPGVPGSQRRLISAAWQCGGPATTVGAGRLLVQNGCSQSYWSASMLRDTAQKLLLFYLVVDSIINPVDLASGKSSRCSEIFADRLCLALAFLFVLTLSPIKN